MRHLLRLCAVGAALGGSLVLAPAAYADPTGCTVDRPIVGLATDGRLMGTVTAYCDASAKRYLRGEIKWAKRFATDPLVAGHTAVGTRSYDASFAACDRHNTRRYYTRGFFTSTPDQHHDSRSRVLTAGC
jgi:hypothetical protein